MAYPHAMAEEPVTAILRDGPHDGETRMVPAQTDVIYVGHIKAAFTDGDIAPPENLIGRDIVGYRLAETMDDGTRIYRYVQPAAARVSLPWQSVCPVCHGSRFADDGRGKRFCLDCPWDETLSV